MFYHYAFLDHAFSLAAGRNPLVTTAAAAAYPGNSSSKREDDHL